MLINKFLLLGFVFCFILIVGTGSSLATANLNALANSAGDYAAWADVCSDPAGASVKSEFKAQADPLPPDQEARIVKLFEDRYQRTKRQADKALKKCVQRGNENCCTDVRSVAGRLNKAKSIHEIVVQKLAKAQSKRSGSAVGSSVTQQQSTTQPNTSTTASATNEGSDSASAQSKFHSDLHFVLQSRVQLDLRLLQLDPTAIQSDGLVYSLARQMYGRDSTPGAHLSEFERKSILEALRDRILSDAKRSPNKFGHHARINLGEYDTELGGFPITPGASVGLNKSSHVHTGWELSSLESCARILCFKSVMHPDTNIAPVKITDKNAKIKVLKMSEEEAQALLQSLQNKNQGRYAHVIIGFSVDRVEVQPKTKYTSEDTYLAYLNILSADIYSDALIRKNETRIDGHLATIPLTDLDDLLIPGKDYDKIEIHTALLPLYLPKLNGRYVSGDLLLRRDRFSKPTAFIGTGIQGIGAQVSLFQLSLNRLYEMLLLRSGHDQAAAMNENSQTNAYLAMMVNHLRESSIPDFESEFDKHTAVNNFKTNTLPLLKTVPTELPLKMLRIEQASLGQYDFVKSGFPMAIMAGLENHDIFPGKLEGLPDLKATKFLPMDKTRAKAVSDRLNKSRVVYVAQELTIDNVLPERHRKLPDEATGKHESLVIYLDEQLTEPLYRF